MKHNRTNLIADLLLLCSSRPRWNQRGESVRFIPYRFPHNLISSERVPISAGWQSPNWLQKRKLPRWIWSLLKKTLQWMVQAERIKAHKENPPWYAKIAQFVLHVSRSNFLWRRFRPNQCFFSVLGRIRDGLVVEDRRRSLPCVCSVFFKWKLENWKVNYLHCSVYWGFMINGTLQIKVRLAYSFLKSLLEPHYFRSVWPPRSCSWTIPLFFLLWNCRLKSSSRKEDRLALFNRLQGNNGSG